MARIGREAGIDTTGEVRREQVKNNPRPRGQTMKTGLESVFMRFSSLRPLRRYLGKENIFRWVSPS